MFAYFYYTYSLIIHQLNLSTKYFLITSSLEQPTIKCTILVAPDYTCKELGSHKLIFNPLTVKFSDTNVFICQTCTLQINHTIYTYRTIY